MGRLCRSSRQSTGTSVYSSRVGGVGVDLDLALDPSVEVDGSEAVRRRLTPPSTSTQLRGRVELRNGRSVHVQGLRWSQRRTSPSTSTPGVNEQVNVDDHDGMARICDESSDVAVKLKDVGRRRGLGRGPRFSHDRPEAPCSTNLAVATATSTGAASCYPVGVAQPAPEIRSSLRLALDVTLAELPARLHEPEQGSAASQTIATVYD